MKFERKIFLALFLSTFVIGSLLVWAGHRYATTRSQDEFIARYSVLNRVLADTLTRLDTSTEALMLNAAQVIADRESSKGLLSNEELRSMTDSLGVTHIFIVDKDGNFIRSTNEKPDLIPNLYSFCDGYRDLIEGGKSQDATPIIKPRPEPKPYKFLFIPNADKSRIVEVGVRVDSIAKTLVEAIKADKNVTSMTLFSPDGLSFGTFSAEKIDFSEVKSQLPTDPNAVADDSSEMRFYSKVSSSHPKCCQCDRSGTSKNGEYYYVLESRVSKDELNAIQARMNLTFVLLALGNTIVSIAIAKLLSWRLVRNIRKAVNRVRMIKESGSLQERIQLSGRDEVVYLTKEFDRLLDVLADSQEKLIEAEKAESKIQLARVVAHNIKSPITAIEMMIPQMDSIPERTRKVLSNSVKEIKQLAEKLRNKPDDIVSRSNLAWASTELVFLPLVIEEVVTQKQIEYGANAEIQFVNKLGEDKIGVFAKVCGIELRSILSNLINNSVESYRGSVGRIEVYLSYDDHTCSVAVKDYGCGIPEQYLKELGRRRITFKDESGRGLGIIHAFEMIAIWGGRIEIASKVGEGTTLMIHLKRSVSPAIGDADRQMNIEFVQG